MRFSVEAKPLAAAAKKVAVATPRRPSLSELDMVRIETHATGAVTLLAGDLETFIEVTVEATVEKSGVVCVPARLFASAAASATGTATVTVDGDELRVKAGRFESGLRTGTVDDYPRVEWGDGPSVPLSDEWPRIAGLLHAASTDQARGILCAVHFNDGTVEATDSYRAARTVIDGLEGGALVPVDAIRHANSILDPTEIRVQIGDYTVTFSDDTTRIVGRQMTGTFPRIDGVWPTSTLLELTVDAGELSAAVSAVGFVDGGKSDLVRLKMDGDVLTVSRIDTGAAAATQAVDATGELPEGSIGFNASYLKEALDGIDGDATFRLVDQMKPVVVEGVSGIDQIVMPVRIS